MYGDNGQLPQNKEDYERWLKRALLLQNVGGVAKEIGLGVFIVSALAAAIKIVGDFPSTGNIALAACCGAGVLVACVGKAAQDDASNKLRWIAHQRQQISGLGKA